MNAFGSIRNFMTQTDWTINMTNVQALQCLTEYSNASLFEKILLETDAPFLAPEPYRGNRAFVKTSDGRGRNEPAYVIEVAKKVAELKGKSFEEVASRTTKNAKQLLGV